MREEADWRDALLAGLTPEPAPAARDPLGWPGYTPRAAVRWARGAVAGADVVAVWWDFSVLGGSFGEADATSFAAAADAAAQSGRPLLSLVRSGGTRLQEGMAALVGIPRALVALRRAAAAGVPHVAVCDAPTTGGVWIGVGSVADLRVAVRGATVGFAGPRVVQAVTGERVPDDSHHADAAAAAGLVDAVVDAVDVSSWLARALRALGRSGDGGPSTPAGSDRHADAGADAGADARAERRGGWEQVLACRARTVGGRRLLGALLPEHVTLAAEGGDRTVAAAVGHLGGPGGPAVVVLALAAEVGGAPTPAGYRLAGRAAALADRLGLPLLSLVDTPGAAVDPESEASGIAAGIAATMDALLGCRAPTVALVHGEGGSGGALAAAVTDRVLVTPLAYFTALGPEGAGAALRRDPAEAADAAGLHPLDLRALGFADRVVPAPDDLLGGGGARGHEGSDQAGGAGSAADAGAGRDGLRAARLAALLAGELASLAAAEPTSRLEARLRRWSSPLPGRVAPTPA